MTQLIAFAHPNNPRFEDLTGQRFGRLTVKCYLGRNGSNASWLVVCDCGAQRAMKSTNLKRSKSCGCAWAEIVGYRNTTHGLTRNGVRPPLYDTWAAMIQRCHCKTSRIYKNYGGRGIRVCDRWVTGDGTKTGFECFIADMGPRPSPSYSIDRINNDGDYSPSNCRWATSKQQNNNRRPRRK